MPTAYVPLDLTDSSYAFENLTTATYTSIVSATGLDMDHSAVGVMVVKNTTGGNLTLNITVPQPASSGFSDIGITPPVKAYIVPLNETVIIANMGSYLDPSTQKLTVDATGNGLDFLAFNQVNRSAKS